MRKKGRHSSSAQQLANSQRARTTPLTDFRYLQNQIDIIRGKRSARPSTDLRGLETQVLGSRRKRNSVETQRWMHPSMESTVLSASIRSQGLKQWFSPGYPQHVSAQESSPQSSQQFSQQHASPIEPPLRHVTKTPSVLIRPYKALASPFSADYIGSGQEATVALPNSKAPRGLCSPFSYSFQTDTRGADRSYHRDPPKAFEWPESTPSLESAMSPETTSFEFMAPGQSRFEVESYEQSQMSATQPDSVRIRESAPLQAPCYPAADSAKPISAALAAENAVREADDGDWFTAAQAEQPKQITAASKESLDSGLVLARDDFERELADILGTAPPPASTSKSDASEFLTQAAQAQSQRESAQGVMSQDGAKRQTPAATAGTGMQDNAPKTAASDENEQPAHPTHDVFDRMGLGLQYANSFDLGQLNLNERFNVIEASIEDGSSITREGINRIFPPTESAAQTQSASTTATTHAFADPFITAEDLDDFDLVAELAQIGGASASVQEQRKNESLPAIHAQGNL